MTDYRRALESRSSGSFSTDLSRSFLRQPLQLAGAALGLTFVLVPFSLGQGSATSISMPATSPEFSVGPLQCTDGSSPISQLTTGCYPADCVSLSNLDWGTGGVPAQVVAVDKFDPGVGTLMQVDLVYKARFVGDLCADNPVLSCGAAQLSASLLSISDPSPTNSPPVTGIGSTVLNGIKVLTPAGFLLGSSDGFDDCATPGVTQGNASTGDCTAGEDHFIGLYDEIFTQPIATLVGADLAPWIGAPGTQVAFDTTASGLVSGSFSASLSVVLNADARVWVEATYYYCPNVPPTCGADDQVTTDEDTPVEIDVLANDIDIDGTIDCTTLRIAAGMGPANGTAIVPSSCSTLGSANCPDPTCRIIYTPNPGFCGVDTFSYEVQDDDGAWMLSCPVTVTVNAVNEAPVAVDDLASSPEGVPFLVDVCANDFDPDGITGCGDDIDCTIPGPANNPLTIITQPDCGGSVATIYFGGRWQMRVNPPLGYCGPCTFTYTIKDTGKPQLESNVATVTLDLLAVNDAPVAVDDFATTPEGAPVVIDICANDSDPDDLTGCGAPLDCTDPGNNPFTLVSRPDCGGSVSFVYQGSRWQARFVPPANFCGSCLFTYTVKDTGTPALTSNVATVTVDVTPVNEAPVAVDDSATTPENTPIVIDVCVNDSDPDDGSTCGAELDCTDPGNNPITIVSPPDCGGTAVVVFEGGRWRVRFAPPANFCSICQFTYTVADTDGLLSNVATVTVDVTAVNEAPVAMDDSATTPEGMPVLIDVCANDTDPDDGTGCGGELDCTLPNLTIVSQPDCGGTVSTVFNSGRWQMRFDPPVGFCGTCVFTYTVEDTGAPPLTSNVATVTIDVTPVNESPIAVDDFATTPESTAVLIDICANDTDPDDATGCGAPLDCTDPGNNPFTIVSQPDCGGVVSTVFNAGRWQARFDPPANFCSVCQFTYSVVDTDGLSSNVATVTVDVTPVNDPPVAVDDKGSSQGGAPTLIDVCANDSDPDDGTSCGDPLNCTDPANNPIQLGTQPACGAFATIFNGGRWQVRYDPTAGFCGQCSITYTVTDEGGLVSNVATIAVTVTLTNNPPLAEDDFVTTPEDTPVSIRVIDNDSDSDVEPCGYPLDPNSVVIISGPDPECGTVDPGPYLNGIVTFTPSPDFCGQCSFTYQVCDSAPKDPLCDTAVVTITVAAVNDCPVAVDDLDYTTEVGVPITVDVCANDSDIDDGTKCGAGLDCSSVMVITQPDCGGTAEAMGDGSIRFTPPAGYVGMCCFTYTVSDGAVPPCISNEAQVCIEVIDPPCITENRRAPGSLLLFPEFDNREGVVSMYTVTNVGNQNIQVEFVYRRQQDCLEFNRKEDLTANDTLTLITNYHNPNTDRGFAYVFAQCPETNQAVAFDKLIGQVLIVDGLDTFSYGINAVSFKGVGGETDTECTSMPLTDLNGNGLRDLDDLEYAMAPDSLRIPRFMGQNDDFSSELILLSLSGGGHFTTTLDFLVYNDNEEVFSSEYSFSCWDRVPLLEISALFGEDFLKYSTDNDPREVLGDPSLESGWMRIDGDIAMSTSTTIYDPAFYAVLVEMVAPDRFVADLPFEQCTQDNGVLLPGGNNGQ